MKNIVMQYPDKTLHVINAYAAYKTSDNQIILKYYDRNEYTFFENETLLINLGGTFYKSPMPISEASFDIIKDQEYSDKFIEELLPSHILCYNEEIKAAYEKQKHEIEMAKINTEQINENKSDTLNLFVVENENTKSISVFFLESESIHTTGKYGFNDFIFDQYNELVFKSIDELAFNNDIKEAILTVAEGDYKDAAIVLPNASVLNIHYDYMTINNQALSEIINKTKLLSIDCSDLSITDSKKILQEGLELKRLLIAVSKNDTVYSNNGNIEEPKKYVIAKK